MSQSASPRRSRRTVIAVLAVVAVVLIIAVVTTVFVGGFIASTAAGPTPLPPAESGDATVTADGFRLELADGVVVSGGPRVAPAGTVVHAEFVQQSIPGDFGSFATAVAPVVDITLGQGLQPTTPITLDFTFTEEQVQSLLIDRLFVLGESATEGRDVDFVESSWDSTSRTMTGTLEHLSWYTVTQVDEKAAAEQVGEWMDQQSGIRTAKPGCVDEPVQPSGSFILATPWPAAAWVCASETADTVTIELQSNSGLMWEILAEPTGEYAPLTALGVSDILGVESVNFLESYDGLEGDSVLVPGGSMQITFPKPFESARVELQIAPAALNQIAAAEFGVSMFLPARWQSGLEWWNCGAQTLDSIQSALNAQAVLGCVAAATTGTASDLLGILTAAPGLLATQVEGAARTVSDDDNEAFTVSLVAADAIRELPPGANWLFDHSTGGNYTSGDEDIASVVNGTTLGAYPFSTNQWVSCTRTPDQGTYDLGGKWSTLSTGLAVQSYAPAGLTATIQIIGDGRVLWSGSASREAPLARMSIDVSGVNQLTVTAITQDTCGGAPKGYGSLVQAFLQ